MRRVAPGQPGHIEVLPQNKGLYGRGRQRHPNQPCGSEFSPHRLGESSEECGGLRQLDPVGRRNASGGREGGNGAGGLRSSQGTRSAARDACRAETRGPCRSRWHRLFGSPQEPNLSVGASRRFTFGGRFPLHSGPTIATHRSPVPVVRFPGSAKVSVHASINCSRNRNVHPNRGGRGEASALWKRRTRHSCRAVPISGEQSA